MTRINVVPVRELCDQHLLAERRELTRIPNAVARGWRPAVLSEDYTLGKGHVTFFADKMQYLLSRYEALHDECTRRGFNVQWIWPLDIPLDPKLWRDYRPTQHALRINRNRIQQRMPVNARFTKTVRRSS